MAVPVFQSFFKPLLDIAADGKEHSIKEACEIIARNMNLTKEDLRELLPSGTQTIFDNRVQWAKTYLSKANILENTRKESTLRQENSQMIQMTMLNPSIRGWY